MNQEEINLLAKSLEAKIEETHISWVLLTKKFAYKIKKPLKTNFLDFSTLKKRKKFCLKELEINQALSPKIYQEVLGIKKSKTGFLFVNAKGKCDDYAVKMMRLDSNKQMNRMLLKGEVKKEHIHRLAKKIALFHSKTKMSKTITPLEDRIKEFSDLLNVKEEIIKSFGKSAFGGIQELVQKEKRFLKEYQACFSERVSAGFIRDCHGDLHSGNIFLYKSPILFDRIEFNDRFRFIDILHEIGFLCMDLEASGQAKLSEKFLHYYLNYSGLVLGEKERLILNYYKCYTANVRAKVILLKSKKEDKDLENVKSYLWLMFKYAYKRP